MILKSRMPRRKEPRFSAGISDCVRERPLSDTLIRMKDLRRASAAQPAVEFSGELDGGDGSALAARNLPLVDPAVLLDLEEQLGDASLARSFAEDFLVATSVRVGRLDAAVSSQDPEDAMDAILGVRATSMMVGAVRLAHLATECVVILRSGDITGAAGALAEVRSCAEQTTALLRDGHVYF